MDVQAAPPTYTPAGGVKPPAGNPPVLGQQVPGMSGGLPALGGLSVTQNPMARELQSYGRGEDSMLVHMTPAEVNSLQGLAMAHGGSLTINPHTGLPEAGWLGKLLPTILGFAGAAFGLPTWAIGLGGAAAGTAATGNLGKGLMMGLQAYGGASLAGGLGVGEAGKKAAELAAKNAGTGVLNNAADTAITVTRTGAQQAAAANAAVNAAQTAGNVVAKTPGIIDKFSAFSKAGMPGFLAKQAPLMAGAGLLSAASEASQPNLPKYQPEESKFKYTSMAPGKREVRFQTPEQMRQSGGAEFSYFTPSNPEPVPVSMLPLEEQDKYRYADGGTASAPPGFEELVASYAANNPGAITAPMYYPATPAPAAEKKYFTTPAAATPTPTPGTGLGGIDLSGLNLGNLGNFGNIDFSNLFVPATPAAQERADAGNNRLEDFSNIGDYSSTFTPNYVQPQTLDINSSAMQSLPAQQPVYSQPAYEAPAYSAPAYEAPNFVQPDTLDIFGGMQSLPAQQPVYSAPAYEAPTYEVPVYEAPAYVPFYDYDTMGGGGGSAGDFMSRNDIDMFARGGAVDMRDGAFVVDARTVSELGNGSSNAGMELLSRMGGKPVRGPGDGVSDSVPASIGGKQEARVARDEVIFQPEAVRRLGGGSEKRGTQKLYALMDKAHKARKKAKRGQDTGVRKGLA